MWALERLRRHGKWYNTHKRDEREKRGNGAGEVFGCIPHGARAISLWLCKANLPEAGDESRLGNVISKRRLVCV